MYSVSFTCNQNVFKMFYTKTYAKCCKTFLQMFQHVEHMLKIGGGYM